jgi:hypothetical protein
MVSELRTKTPDHDKRLAICVAEDRKSSEPALRLLLESLCRCNTDILVTVFYPDADQDFSDWVHKLHSERIAVRTIPLLGAYGWNVKPQALLKLLDEGNEEVVWIDSDVIVTKDIVPAFTDLNTNVLLVTEEALWGGQDDTGALRARLWKFPIKRSFPFVLNTAVMRVTQNHIPLLERWKTLLESPEYKRAQAQPWNTRPRHMLSDQDVLTALLCCEEFHDIPVKVLRRGRDIIQYFGLYGFTLAERVTCIMRGMPKFIHAQGSKPWLRGSTAKPDDFRRKVEALYMDLSPYTLAASSLCPTHNKSWTRPHSALSSALRKLGFGYAPLVGLPIAAACDLARIAKSTTRFLVSSLSQILRLRTDAPQLTRASIRKREGSANVTSEKERNPHSWDAE